MKDMRFTLLLMSAMTVVAFTGLAEVMDRPVGYKIGERMTLLPYVSVSATYDSNVDSRRDGSDDVTWIVNPGLGLDYKGESFYILANVFYQYNDYAKGSGNSSSYHGYGEDVTYRWSNSKPGERGWSLMLTERFMKVNNTEDVTQSNGRGYGSNRQEFKGAGALQRRFTEKWHGDINASYYWLDYDNDRDTSMALYGWQRWLVGLEAGYAASPWTDILLAGSYQGYSQDNVKNRSAYYNNNRGISSHSDGWTVQGGLGSYATERITYRVLGGWSYFKYAESSSKASSGFTYSANGNWKIGDTWNTMIQAASHYQPSEREYGSSQRVDSFSWGLAHSMVRGKLNGTFDICYRRETHEYSAMDDYAYDLDLLSCRFGLNYIINRYVSVFGAVDYTKSFGNGDDESRSECYDYNRFRGTLGLRFTY